MSRALVAVVAVALLAVACASGNSGGGLADAPFAGSGVVAAPSPDRGDDGRGRRSTVDTPSSDVEPCRALPELSRTDNDVSGNRVVDVSLDLAAGPSAEVLLPARVDWVIADPVEAGSWIAVLDEGQPTYITSDGDARSAGVIAGPPELQVRTGRLSSAHVASALVADPIPHARVVYGGRLGESPPTAPFAATLIEPTDRYGHAVLGDGIEAGAIAVIDRCNGIVSRIAIESPEVVEGTSVMFADVDGDGVDELLATLGGPLEGARLVVYELDGSIAAEGPAIGRGNRWRNQLGVAPLGPGGEIEVVDVRTPHLGGTVEFFRSVDGQLVRVAASAAEYTTHALGSINLDQGVIVDANADGRLDVVVLTSGRDALVALSRVGDGVEVVARFDLGSTVTSNLAVAAATSQLGVGLADGRFLVFGGDGG